MAERESLARETSSTYGVSSETNVNREDSASEKHEEPAPSSWENVNKPVEDEDDLDIPPSLRARLRGKK